MNPATPGGPATCPSSTPPLSTPVIDIGIPPATAVPVILTPSWRSSSRPRGPTKIPSNGSFCSCGMVQSEGLW